MARQLLNLSLMMTSEKTPSGKGRKRTIAQILRAAYSRHCRDRATRNALRLHLKR